MLYYVVQSEKKPEVALEDLKKSIVENKFGVLHVHDLKAKMIEKGIDFKNSCYVLEVCNPNYASSVLKIDMMLNMALPCRVSVFEDNEKTKIGMLKPETLLGVLSSDKELNQIASEVEETLKTAIESAK